MKKMSLVLLLACAACGKNAHELGKTIEKEMRVPVTVLAEKEDKCVIHQLETLVAQYDDLSKGAKKATRSRLKEYGSIRILPTQTTEILTGDYVTLSLMHTVCSSRTVCSEPPSVFDYCDSPFSKCSCWTETNCDEGVYSSVVVKNTVRSEGEPAITQLRKTKGLEIETRKLESRVAEAHYETYSPNLYAEVYNGNLAALESAAREGNVTRNQYKTQFKDDCGREVTLEQVLKD